jgi:hypothetical protein
VNSEFGKACARQSPTHARAKSDDEEKDWQQYQKLQKYMAAHFTATAL